MLAQAAACPSAPPGVASTNASHSAPGSSTVSSCMRLPRTVAVGRDPLLTHAIAISVLRPMQYLPGGRRLTAVLNAFSIDLEEWFQVANFDHCIDRKSWPELPSRAEAQTHRLLDLCDRTRTRATFFVLGWVAERKPQLVREIAARGHEIACHGYGHELIYEIGPDRFREEVKRACGVIEDAGRAQAHVTRARSIAITPQPRPVTHV